MRKETIKTLQGDCHENEKNNEIGGPNNSIKKRNERIIEAYQTENTSIAELAERFGVSKRTIGNVTHSLKEQNLQQQSLTNETTKEKEESNNQNIEAYLAGDLWVSKLVNKFNGSARTILMKIKKVREQKEEMQYKTSSENEILQLDRNSFEQREELVKQQLSERQESNKLFDESSNSQQVEYPIMEQTMAGKAVNQPGSENNQVNFIEDQNQEYLIDEEKHPQNPHNIHNDRGTGEFIQKKQDKSIKNSENTPVNQNQETALDEERHPKRAAAHLSENLHSIQNLESNLGDQTTKQTDKQLNPPARHSLDPVLPQKVNQSYTKNDYLKYIQLYQSIQTTIKIETFCDIMELSQDTFQELLKEAVPDESTNSELGYIENKKEIIPREYKLEMVNLYLNSQHSYKTKWQFCAKNDLDYDSFRSWIRKHKKGELTRQSISTIEELISREQDGRNLYCTAKVKKACVLLWRSKRIAHKVLCKKLNISDATLRTWNNRYDQARGKKQELITTLTELKERKLEWQQFF